MIDFREEFQLPSLNDAIDDELNRLNESFNKKKYDTAINFGRSVLESTCKFICCKFDNSIDVSCDNFDSLIKSTLKCLNLSLNDNLYVKLRELVDIVAKVRNHTSVSHGHREKKKIISESEARFYCSLFVDISIYLLRIDGRKSPYRNKIGEFIDPLNSEYKDLSINGYKVQVRQCLNWVDSACIEFYKDVNLEEAIKLSGDVIDRVLPVETFWKERKEETKNKFKIYSSVYDRECTVVFEKVNNGWLIYIDNINTENISFSIKTFRSFLTVDEKYDSMGRAIISQREEINNEIKTQVYKSLKRNSVNLTKNICSEICNQNEWIDSHGDARTRLNNILSKFLNVIIYPQLLLNVTKEVISYIQFDKLNLVFSDDYVLYSALVDDLSLLLIDLQSMYKRSKNIKLINVIGGKFDQNDSSEFKKLNSSVYISSTVVLDILLTVQENIIIKIDFKFKTIFNLNDEFVTDTIRDYLPSDSEYKSGNNTYSEYHLDSLNKSFIVKYSKHNKALIASLEGK